MNEPAPTPSPSPSPTPSPAPSPEPVVAQRPEWLPEDHWDAEKATIKEDFGAHYTELSTAQKAETERKATLAARKPEDIKFEVKLPPEVKVPEGMKVTIDEKDPRVPILREMALEQGWDQPVIDKLVAMDARLKIEQHAAEVERVKAEDAKLGANGNDRKTAVANWVKGLKEKGDLTAEEYEEGRLTATTAAGVTFLEKVMAKAAGTVPGNTLTPPPKPTPVSQDARWYPDMTSQQKVS